ncbi:phage portal protein [Parabacteroides distasonis]|jgi:HK97 family phage portal protein|uniref:phage portal protein n=1 Tax=Parabacteroides distasonis TaxID=823 RepID=UPI000EFC0CE6|nr:phage portal protein [Parabacteroides distasonis]RHB90660.1 phage portal protein [Parabacteroides distasonis]RHM53351.1 phage portal protein [Parabacteroides distasonis]
MRFLGLDINIRRSQKKEPVESFVNVQRFGGGSSRKPAMTLAAVYRCVNVISESVAQLPLDTFKKDNEGYKSPYVGHPAYDLLREFPNPDMTRFTFLKTLVSSVLLNGNGYAYVDRDEYGNALSLQYIPSGLVSVVYITVDGIPRMRYQVTGFKSLVEPSDMIHVLNFSYDGITGVSTLTHARNTLGISSSAEDYAKQFFSDGGGVMGILSFDTKLRDGQKEEIKKAWADMVSNGGIGVLEANSHYQSVSINPSDAQMLETRQFNVIDICRFFGVSPVKAFDLSKSSYSTVEATQLAFLTDTLAPLLENIELEMKRKVFRPSEISYVEVKFDTSNLLRADKAAQATFMKTMYEMGGMTPNEARRMMDMPKVKNGDQPLVNNAMVPLEFVANKKFDAGKERS